jgi:hypothetical protein
MATPKYQSAGSPPSAWAIVIVAAILILVPALFCGGILFMVSGHKPEQSGGQQMEPIKRQELNP